MGVQTVELLVNTSNTVVGATVVDVTVNLSGTSFSLNYSVGTANTTRWFWLRAVDDFANETTQALGSFTTDDVTAPVIASATQAAGTPATTSIDLTFSVTDNDPAGPQAIYVYQSSVATAPDAATVKTSGVAKAGNASTHTFSGLSPNTQYYAWILGRDSSGNESAVTAFTPASLTTAADTSPPTITSFSLAAGTDPESEVLIVATISDSV